MTQKLLLKKWWKLPFNFLSFHTLHLNSKKLKNKTVVIVDEVWMGHVPTFHKLIVSSFLKLGFPVISISPNPPDINQWMVIQGIDKSNLSLIEFDFNQAKMESEFGLIKKIKQYFINVALGLLIKVGVSYETVQKRRRYEMAKLLWIKANETIKMATKNKSSDDIFTLIPYIDHRFLAPGITKRFIENNYFYNWAGLCISPLKLLSDSKTSAWRINIFHAANCKGLLMCDDTLLDILRNTIDNNIWAFPEVADMSVPNEPSELENEIKSKAKGRVIISLLGQLTPLKNLMLLYKVAEISHQNNLSYFFVFAGHLIEGAWTPEQLTTLKQSNQPENCFLYLNRLSELELNSIARGSDILFAAYKDFNQSSNIQTKSAHFHKPIVVSKGHIMENRSITYNLGFCVDQSSADEVLEAIKIMSSDEWKNEFNKRDLSTFNNMHSKEAVKKLMAEIINTVSK